MTGVCEFGYRNIKIGVLGKLVSSVLRTPTGFGNRETSDAQVRVGGRMVQGHRVEGVGQ